MIKKIECKKPTYEAPKMSCDFELHKILNEYEL